ncbi:MAG: rhomboid family intramembrane serine protease [candidate division Zixibacteria bacterium]|nr:rhomboid family intramembrane serine protease [candidate division Zixibacteria bacterium]
MIPFKDDNPRGTTPYVTIALIAINVIVFIYEFSLGQRGFTEFTVKYGLIPAELMSGRDLMAPEMSYLSTSPYLNLFTSMFMHGGFMHLGGNMLYLWIFGDNIEDTLGHVWFAFFYIISGIAATLTFVFIEPSGEVPLVGASGAIAGVLGAYLVRFPYAKVYTLIFLFYFIRIIRLPAVFVLGFWFILQLISGTNSLAVSQSGGGVAWFAHIGGFAFGAILFLVLGKRPKKIHRFYR